MIDKSFIDAIVALTQGREFAVNEQTYTTKPVYPLEPPKRAIASPVEINTLTGLTTYVDKVSEWEADADAGVFVHVVDHRTVHVVSGIFGDHRQWEYLVKAKAEDLFNGANNGFQFNNFYSHAKFMIAIQTLFVQGHNEWDKLTKVIGNIKEEAVKQSSDDGISQSVVAKSGVALVTDLEVPRIVTLKPYRTFREVEQPASQFLVRLQSKPNALPEIGLFEADGGKWKNDAIEAVCEYLQENIKMDLPIIA